MNKSMQARRVASLCRVLAILALVCSAMALAGCRNRLSGKYEATGSDRGIMTIEFIDNTRAHVTWNKISADTDYTVDGDKVTFADVGGNPLIMTFQKNGTLAGPDELTLKRY
jgi:hypothetical protein